MVQSDTKKWCRHIKSFPKREIVQRHLDGFPYNIKTDLYFFSSCSVGSIIDDMSINGNRNVLSTLCAQCNNYPTIHSILFTLSADSNGDVSSGFMFCASTPYVIYGDGYG